MNALACFIYSKINDSGDDSEKNLSSLEKLALKDLQALFNCSPQDVAKILNQRPSPAEWPVANYPISAQE